MLKAPLALTVATVLGTCSFVFFSYISQKDCFYITKSICVTNFKKCSKDEDFCLKFKSPQSRIPLQQGNPQRHRPTGPTQQQPRHGHRGNPEANGRKLDLNKGLTTLDNESMCSPTDKGHCNALTSVVWSNGTVCIQPKPFTTFVHPDDTLTTTDTENHHKPRGAVCVRST